MKKQVFNPYLPLNVYIPDGEPHVFGDRVYVYGSHDQEGGQDFCVLDYEVWSAPVDDLTDWSCPGVAYRAKQDSDWNERRGYAMYAPDCVRGNDGRYYLYYALAGGGLFTGNIHAAVSDRPDGPFAYHGCVRNPDGSPLTTFITFDPAVMNDEGTIRLYYGWSLAVSPERMPAGGVNQEMLKPVMMQLFDKTAEEIDGTSEGIMGANTVELEDDMLTVKRRPVRIAPGQFDAAGTSFAGHAFFEGSSIRKVGDTYYFVYSSEHQHELCYATSLYPDRDFTFGGVIVSNGDIGLKGRRPAERLMMTGNNHGSIENINGQWYVFYHRQTHLNTFSRQGCAEKIKFLPDGSIPQVEMTSCGLNGGPLPARGVYPASICCNLTNGHMPHADQQDWLEPIPHIAHEGVEHFVAGMTDGAMIGYKYFSFEGSVTLKITLRGNARGKLCVQVNDDEAGAVEINSGVEWHDVAIPLSACGKGALYMEYYGEGSVDVRDLVFC
ncbi:MAG: family 43 glycosylhydrolase [Clostridia bacterium]|nr:family 43 glycosylhydrolase [Clostridia bacterium]